MSVNAFSVGSSAFLNGCHCIIAAVNIVLVCIRRTRVMQFMVSHPSLHFIAYCFNVFADAVLHTMLIMVQIM